MPPWLYAFASTGAGGDWLAATHTSLREIYHLGRPLMMGYLRHIFTAGTAPVASGGTIGPGRAAAEGLLFGAAQSLPASASGQTFGWPYLLHGTPLSPAADPGAWAVCLLAAGVALGILLREPWTAVWQSLRKPAGDGAAASPEWVALAAAVIPCWLIQLRLHGVGDRLEAAAAVGVLLLVTGQCLRLGERWAQRSPGTSAHVPPWLAFAGGVLAGLGTLPGLSAVAILLAAGLYARASAEGAARFALMVTNAVIILQGLGGTASLVGQFQLAYVPLAAGAALGAAAGGWVLLAVCRAVWQKALPIMASYCTAVGGLLLMFGTLAR